MRILVVTVLLVLASLASACRPDSGGASAAPTSSASDGHGLVIVPEGGARPYFHDFGDRLWGEQIEHTYLLENREGRTIVVHDLLPDCGCTRPRAAVLSSDGSRVEGALETRGMELAVPAGATLEVRIGVDTTRVERPNAHKLAQVRLRCDSEVTPYITFELHLRVIRTFRSAPPEAVLKSVPRSTGKSVRTDISTEIAGDGARIRGIETVEGPFHAELTETLVGVEPVWVLVVRADPGLELGPHAGKVVFGTTLSDGTGIGQNFAVPISAQVVEDCVVEPRVIAIPRDANASTSAVLQALVPGATVSVRSARFEGGAAESLRATYQAIEPDDAGRASRWRIDVRSEGQLPSSAFSGKLILELDDPNTPVVEVPYAAPPG